MIINSIIVPLAIPLVIFSTPFNSQVDHKHFKNGVKYVSTTGDNAKKEVDRIKKEELKKEQKKKEKQNKSLGVFYITAYAETGNPCANGNYPTVGKTVACNSLPMGTVVYIDGVGKRVVEDRGASWHSDNWMDLYLGEVSTCMEWGKQQREVYIVKKGA